MGSLSGHGGNNGYYDLSFKILLVGDSGVGKSSVLVSFISDSLQELSPTIGVDFKIKLLCVSGKRVKLTIWDTAGQEKFRALTSSYYRNALGVILVYDVTKRETFTTLSERVKEVDLNVTNAACVKMVVGNKVDRESDRAVSSEEGIALAKEHGCLFMECSAKTRANVEICFKELAGKIMENPSLVEEGGNSAKKSSMKKKAVVTSNGGCCL